MTGGHRGGLATVNNIYDGLCLRQLLSLGRVHRMLSAL